MRYVPVHDNHPPLMDMIHAVYQYYCGARGYVTWVSNSIGPASIRVVAPVRLAGTDVVMDVLFIYLRA